MLPPGQRCRQRFGSCGAPVLRGSAAVSDKLPLVGPSAGDSQLLHCCSYPALLSASMVPGNMGECYPRGLGGPLSTVAQTMFCTRSTLSATLQCFVARRVQNCLPPVRTTAAVQVMLVFGWVRPSHHPGVAHRRSHQMPHTFSRAMFQYSAHDGI